jgi:hypothetical protein
MVRLIGALFVALVVAASAQAARVGVAELLNESPGAAAADSEAGRARVYQQLLDWGVPPAAAQRRTARLSAADLASYEQVISRGAQHSRSGRWSPVALPVVQMLLPITDALQSH